MGNSLPLEFNLEYMNGGIGGKEGGREGGREQGREGGGFAKMLSCLLMSHPLTAVDGSTQAPHLSEHS